MYDMPAVTHVSPTPHVLLFPSFCSFFLLCVVFFFLFVLFSSFAFFSSFFWWLFLFPTSLRPPSPLSFGPPPFAAEFFKLPRSSSAAKAMQSLYLPKWGAKSLWLRVYILVPTWIQPHLLRSNIHTWIALSVSTCNVRGICADMDFFHIGKVKHTKQHPHFLLLPSTRTGVYRVAKLWLQILYAY